MTKTEVGYPKGGKIYKVEKNFGNDPRAEIVSNQDRAVNLILGTWLTGLEVLLVLLILWIT